MAVVNKSATISPSPPQILTPIRTLLQPHAQGNCDPYLILITRARIIDQDIQAAKLLLGRLDQLLPDAGVGHAAGDGGDVVRDVVGRKVFRERVAVQVAGDDFAPLGDEELGRCEAEAGSGACDCVVIVSVEVGGWEW